jgi:ATP adenylyltransferase
VSEQSLEQLWAGWRREYVTSASVADRRKSGANARSVADTRASGDAEDDGECVFCRIAASGPPSADNGVVWRSERTYAVLNAYPYASGHLLVAPVRHVGGIDQLTPQESAELWEATVRSVSVISAAYDPDGINMGANLGRAAGAGLPDHVHLHVVPRWSGDTNFMTTLAGVRVIPESLTDTWRRLHDAWSDGESLVAG